MSAFGIREAMNSILSGCSGNVSIAVDHRSWEDNKSAAPIDSSSSNKQSTATTVLVALDASSSKGVSAGCIKWATSNVLQDGDGLLILAIYTRHQQHHGGAWKMWGFPKLAGECATSTAATPTTKAEEDPVEAIKERCTRMALKICDTKKVHVRVKLVTEKKMVATEARKAHVSWAVLDRNLKKEAKSCMQTAACNVVIVNQLGGFRILCLKNLRDKAKSGLLPDSELGRPFHQDHTLEDPHKSKLNPSDRSSPEVETPFTATERGSTSSSLSSSSSYEHDACKSASSNSGASNSAFCANYYPDSLGNAATKTNSATKCLADENLLSETKAVLSDAESFIRLVTRSISPQDITDHFSALHLEFEDKRQRRRSLPPSDNDMGSPSPGLVTIDESSVSLPSTSRRDRFGEHLSRTSRVRKAVSLPLVKRSVAGSPPLCSICQHSSPDFGRPPKRFTYAELEFATGSFCSANFLAEGGYGSVHRGVLADGIPVAVKQYKLASSQGDLEFCSEVEVLSCAQHRNVVMLIGYCIEQNRRLLVYEFICNGSLDSHLYGQSPNSVLKWSSRHRIALGAARGLRYLHEECRVGCIVHRDLRPNNILLTHDFEPMVGDFGLARWQPDGDLGVETRVIGTFGYLAPEYTQTGHITEKADVYSFGVVLLELVTGRKAIDISRPRGQQCLTEWARPLLEEQAHYEMIDPLLKDDYNQYEAFCMLYAASLCTQRDPLQRPRMSQVLRMLEGDLNLSRNASPLRSNSGRFTYSPRSNTTPRTSPSPRPSKLFSPSPCDQTVTDYMSAHPIIGCDTKLSLQALKAVYKDHLNM